MTTSITHSFTFKVNYRPVSLLAYVVVDGGGGDNGKALIRITY
jgi:hypothetical protein